MPFGGIYRLIDFALSNVINSRYLHVIVLTQYKSHSLDRHVSKTWRMSPLLGNYVAAVPAQQRVGKHWYLGSADAIYQCLNIIDDERPDIVVVVGADHVYRMDFSQMVDAHIASGAEFTVAAIRQPIEEADQFGVIEVDPDGPHAASRAFLEKPTDPVGPGRLPRRDPRVDGQLRGRTRTRSSTPSPPTPRTWTRGTTWAATSPRAFVERGTAGVYDFIRNDVPGSTARDRDYWRDVGTIDAFYEANIDLISDRAGVQPLQRRVAALQRVHRPGRRPSSCTPAPGGSGTPRTRSSRPAC